MRNSSKWRCTIAAGHAINGDMITPTKRAMSPGGIALFSEMISFSGSRIAHFGVTAVSLNSAMLAMSA